MEMQLMCLFFVSNFPTKLSLDFYNDLIIRKSFIAYAKLPFGETLYFVESSELALYVVCTAFSRERIFIKLSLLL